MVVGAIAIGALFVLRSDARELCNELASGTAVVCLAGSAIAGALTLWLVWRRRYALARYGAAAAVGAITLGWALAKYPDLLPGHLTVDDAAATRPTLVACCRQSGSDRADARRPYRLATRGELEEPFDEVDRHVTSLGASGGAA